MKKLISATCVVTALLSGYSIYRSSNENPLDNVMQEMTYPQKRKRRI